MTGVQTCALPISLAKVNANPSIPRKFGLGLIFNGLAFLLLMFALSSLVNPADNNMSGPLLARSFGELLFAVISAIAFATILGTVSGLIVAASGAIAHDLFDRFFRIKMDDRQKVNAGKVAAFVIGGIAILLGIMFQGVNVTFLVGLAFAVAASANLPAIVMLLFWKRTTAKGIAASIVVGIIASLGLIALSPELFKIYGLNPLDAPFPLNNPGIVSIPLSFLTLIVVSLLTQKREPVMAPVAA